MAEVVSAKSSAKIEHNENVVALSTDPGGALPSVNRYISFKPILALGLTLQSSWEAIAVVFQAAFINGGPAALVYGIIPVTLGSLALASTLGEMAAVDPTVGAQYRWAIRYAPKWLKPQLWGYIQGWLTVFAWIASCTATPFILGTVVQALIQFNDATYMPKQWHTTLLAWAFVVFSVVTNLFARKILPVLENVAGILHIGFFFGIVITLGVLVPRNSHSFVWNTVVGDVSGWSAGPAFCIGLLSPAVTVAGFDGIIHMSDETKHANSFIPRAMIFTVLINGLLAFGFTICLLYTMGDPSMTLTQSAVPIITIFYNATGSVATTNVLMSFIVIVLSAGGFSIFASVSRLTYAFARDGGLPFSDFFAYIHPTLRIPLNALILVAILNALICIINIGSTVAVYAIISLAVFSLYISYLPPVIFLLIRKFKGEAISTTGPGSLGRLGLAINIFALCYAIFMIVWLPFPTSVPVTAETLNYAAPIWAGCMLFAIGYYVAFGHRRFRATGEEDVKGM